MECMLLPSHPTASPIQVPYVASQRYDGGEWFSYPERQYPNRPRIVPEEPLTLHQHLRDIPNTEIESYFQTWLFFGLLSEFFGGNKAIGEDLSLCEGSHTQGGIDSNKVLTSVYKDFTHEDGLKVYTTTSMLLQNMQDEVRRTLSDRQTFIKHCMRMGECLTMTWKLLQVPSDDFNPSIRKSIAVVGEILSYSMQIAFSKFRVNQTCANRWHLTFFRQDPMLHQHIQSPKEIMLANGWCPSDISRSMSKFNSIQMLYFLSRMCKTYPTRNHQDCNEVECKLYQIKQDYQLSHVTSECSCLPLAMNSSIVVSILENEDTIPLLRFVGDMNDIRIETVPYSKDMQYIAISHVWADGLGNQTANSLSRCQLIYLRRLVQAIGQEEKASVDSSPLIWIDTLCCPVESVDAKRKSIEKIRDVYQHARHVLVLDAGLRAYESRGMGVVEQLARIFTSSWLRRLWTLQEGALAESLYFQFADRAVSLEALRKEIEQLSSDLRHWIFMRDITDEYLRIQAFFHAHRFDRPGPDLNLLNSALQYRSVSVASDEPLCIGTLMSLDLKQIISKEVPESERMRIVWKLLAEKNGGIPAQVIYLPDTKIEMTGWRWAPASLLPVAQQLKSIDTRIIEWSDTQLGQPTPYGLHVQFPGFRLRLSCIDDKRPHQPWRGVERISMPYLVFRGKETGTWHMIFDQEIIFTTATNNKKDNKIQDAYKKLSLHDLLLRDDFYIIEQTMGVGIIATLSPVNETVQLAKNLDGLAVQARHHIVVKPVSEAQGLLYSSVERLAQSLRNDNLTNELLSIEDANSEEYELHLKALKQKMKDLMAEALGQNPALGEAVDLLWGSHMRDSIWVLIGDWYHQDLVGTRLPDGQMWYVD